MGKARLGYPVPDSPLFLSNVYQNYVFIVNIIVVLYVNQSYWKIYKNVLFYHLLQGNTLSKLETEKLDYNVKC